MAKRCAGMRDDGRPCEGRPLRGSDFCLWHGEASRPAVRWVKASYPLEVPSAVLTFPEGLRLTAYSVPRVRWCRALLARVAAWGVGTEREHLPFNNVSWEPLLIFGGRDDEPGLPLAALVVWRPDG